MCSALLHTIMTRCLGGWARLEANFSIDTRSFRGHSRQEGQGPWAKVIVIDVALLLLEIWMCLCMHVNYPSVTI